MKKMMFHGECVIRQISKMPEGLNRVTPENGYVKIAESEVTGNHHQVEVKNKDIEFYEKDGLLYAKVNEPTTIGCVLKERHDDIPLPVGFWQFSKAVEFQPFKRTLQSVLD